MASRNNIIPKEQMTPYQRWELASFDEAEELPPPTEEELLDEPPPPPSLTAEELDAIPNRHARKAMLKASNKDCKQVARKATWLVCSKANRKSTKPSSICARLPYRSALK